MSDVSSEESDAGQPLWPLEELTPTEGAPVDGAEASLEPELIQCWRCEKFVAVTSTQCGYCRANIATDSNALLAGDSASSAPESAALMRVIFTFGGLLATSLVYGSITQFGFEEPAAHGTERDEHLSSLLAFELIDSVLVVASLFWVGRPPRTPCPSAKQQLLTWCGAAPVLATLVALNAAYHALLKRFLAVPWWLEALAEEDQLTTAALMLTCVQPAIIEELFFRYLALGTLRRATGIHLAILSSSVMFGISHLGAPLSIPMLTLIGICLGYLRVLSGGVALPILVHFTHNFIILWLNSLQ